MLESGAKTAIPLPAPDPAGSDENGNGFLALVLLFVVFAGLLYRLHLALWKRIDQRINAAVERVKAEVPPLLHVEEQMRGEMKEFRQRLTSMEARTHNLQEQIDRSRGE